MNGPDDRYKQLLEGFPQGIVFFFADDDPLRYAFVGGDGLDEIGLTPEDLEGRPVAENRPPEVRDGIREQYRRALDGEELTYEVEAEGRTFRFFIGPLRGDDGAVIGGRGIAQDVTEQAVYEAELERQNTHLEHVTQLLFHDLRNPLNVAKGRLELLKQDTESEHLGAIERALDRIEALTEAELQLHANGRGRSIKRVRLVDVATAGWQNVATKDATLRTPGDVTFRAEESDLRRLFENLIRNAVEHGGSDVTLFVEPLSNGFAVEDDGPGIPADKREAVFERGTTYGDDGTGLGLFICGRVADEHGWQITATDGQQGGARFEVTGVEIEITDADHTD